MINEVPNINETIHPKKIVYEENKKLDNINYYLKITSEKTTGITLIKDSSDKDRKTIIFKVAKKSHIEGKVFIIDKFKRRIKNKKGRRNKHSFLILRKALHGNLVCDNMSKKIKSWTISSIIKFINKKLVIKGDDNGKKTKKKNLGIFHIINRTLTNNTVIQYNRELLQKKIYEILSNNVSKKTKVKDEKHNSKLIEKIKEENKYIDIINILNLTFLRCINHFIGKEKIESLKGFEKYYQVKIASINYVKRFSQFVNNIEKYYSDKDFRIKMNKKQFNLE